MDVGFQEHIESHRSLLSKLLTQNLSLPKTSEDFEEWARLKNLPIIPISLYQEVVTDLNGWYSYHSAANSAHVHIKELLINLAACMDRSNVVPQFFPNIGSPAQSYFAAEHLALNILAGASLQADGYRESEGLFEKQKHNPFESIADLVKATFPELSPSRHH
jgi:hypothetical protein